MKKTLVLVLAVVAAISMFCSTAFAGQGEIAPVVWDGFEVNIRKADPANVVKDGIIGKDEYDQIAIDNEKLVFVNYTVPDDPGFDWEGFKSLAEDLKKSMKVFVSWDETNGFNIAIQYHVPKAQATCTNAGGDETFVFSRLGGVLIQVRNNAQCTPLDDPDHSWEAAGIWGGNVVYDNIGWNTDTNSILRCLYQAGYDSKNGNKLTPENLAANTIFKYDEATETVTVEVSYALNQVIRDDDPNKIYFAPQAMRGQTKGGNWGDALADAVFGMTGFYVKQEIITNQRCITGNVVDEAVGYVEPEPTPTPAPTPIIKEVEKEVAVTPVWAYIAIAVAAVAVIALVVVLVTKKK